MHSFNLIQKLNTVDLVCGKMDAYTFLLKIKFFS